MVLCREVYHMMKEKGAGLVDHEDLDQRAGRKCELENLFVCKKVFFCL